MSQNQVFQQQQVQEKRCILTSGFVTIPGEEIPGSAFRTPAQVVSMSVPCIKENCKFYQDADPEQDFPGECLMVLQAHAISRVLYKISNFIDGMTDEASPQQEEAFPSGAER